MIELIRYTKPVKKVVCIAENSSTSLAGCAEISVGGSGDLPSGIFKASLDVDVLAVSCFGTRPKDFPNQRAASFKLS